MKYLLASAVICLIAVGLIMLNKYTLLAGVMLIVGAWLGIKGRNKIDTS